MIPIRNSHNLANFSTKDIMRHKYIAKNSLESEMISIGKKAKYVQEIYERKANFILLLYPEIKKNENNNENFIINNVQAENNKKIILNRLYIEGLLRFPDEKSEKELMNKMIDFYKNKIGSKLKDSEINIFEIDNNNFLDLISIGKIPLDIEDVNIGINKNEIDEILKFLRNLRTSKIGLKGNNIEYSHLDRIIFIVENDITEYKNLVDKKQIEELFVPLTNSLFAKIDKLEKINNHDLIIQLLELKESYILLMEIFKNQFKEDEFKIQLENFKRSINRTIKILKELLEN